MCLRRGIPRGCPICSRSGQVGSRLSLRLTKKANTRLLRCARNDNSWAADSPTQPSGRGIQSFHETSTESPHGYLIASMALPAVAQMQTAMDDVPAYNAQPPAPGVKLHRYSSRNSSRLKRTATRSRPGHTRLRRTSTEYCTSCRATAVVTGDMATTVSAAASPTSTAPAAPCACKSFSMQTRCWHRARPRSRSATGSCTEKRVR